nr:MAG TPA: hypothetical protein [Bacteriophage sp.]
MVFMAKTEQSHRIRSISTPEFLKLNLKQK